MAAVRETRESAAGEQPVRAFVALELPRELRVRIGETAAALRERVAGARFVAAEGIHLTLRFLGPTRPEQLRRLVPALEAAACACPALSVRVAELGTFPPRGAPRVLWLGLDAPAELLALQGACEGAARAAGFAPEGRAWRPHLTLARWRSAARRPELPTLDLGETRLRTLVVFRSELRREGARYTPLHSYELLGT